MSRKTKKVPSLIVRPKHKEQPIICPKCGKPSWNAQIHVILDKYEHKHQYWRFRHPDKRKKCGYRSCYVKE